jgi:drug/metabolite transporter (DMT)-like permease
MSAPMSLRAWLLLLTLALIWGSGFFFADIALTALPPLTIAWLRVMLGALFLVLMLRLAGEPWPRRWREYALMGLLNNAIPFSLIFLGQATVGGAAAAVLNATTPAFVVLVAHVTGNERMTLARGPGVLLGVLGVALMIGLDSLQGVGSAAGPALLIVAAAVSYALAGLYGRRFRGEPALATATGQVVCSSLLLAPVALFVDRPWTLPMPSSEVWFALASLGLLATAIAYRLYFAILALAGATNLLLVTLLIPPSTMALRAVFLGKPVGLPELAGFAVIALSLAAIDGRALRLLRPLRPVKPSA